jgi:hypothetical protein
MTVNYTTNLALGQPVTGTESGTWGDDVNNSVTSYLDIAIAGGLSVTVTVADVTLVLTQGTSSATNIGSTTAQYAILNVSGAMTAARNLILPSSSRQYVINNNTTGGFALTVKGSATSGVTMVNGEKAQVFWNGSDYAKLSNAPGGAGTFSSITNTGLTSGRVVYSTTGGLETDSANLTFDGTNFATTGTATAAKLIPTGSSATGNGLYLPAANSVGISTNGTNAVYIDSTQNVGIGTSSPVYQTQIYGTGQSTAALTDAGNKGGSLLLNTPTVSGGDGGALLFGAGGSGAKPYAAIKGLLADGAGNTTGHLAFSTRNATADTALTERMRIDSSGNVGIGTSSPGAKLVVIGSTAKLYVDLSGDNYYDAANHVFRNFAGAERMRIDSSGNLLVGTTSATTLGVGAAPVQTDGSIFSGGSNAGFAFKDRSAATFSLWYKSGGTNYFYTSGAGANVATINETTGIYTPLSDVNKKKDFEPSFVGLDVVMQLQPKLFRMLSDDGAVPKQLGFIAQDVQSILPQAYVEQKNGDSTFIGLQDRPFIAALVKAIQEQQALITSLTARITALEST